MAHKRRFHVLLTQDRPYADEHWTCQLPKLLEPQGFESYVVHSGKEAIEIAGKIELHAAVVDLGTPFDLEPGALPAEISRAERTAEMWLELFRRLPNRPPMVIVHQSDYSSRRLNRVMREALELGAFSILSKPVEMETLLEVFRRMFARRMG